MDAVFHWIHGRINFDRESNRRRSTSFDNVIAIASFSFRDRVDHQFARQRRGLLRMQMREIYTRCMQKGAANTRRRWWVTQCDIWPPPMRRSSPRGASRDSQARIRTETQYTSIRYKLILRAISGRFYRENVKSLIIYNLQTIRYDKGLSHKTKLSSCDYGKASF